MTPIEKLDEIQARLDTISSDSKWLNDGLAELREMLVAAAPTEEMPEGMFTDMAQLSALQGLMQRWTGHELFNAGQITLQQATASLARQAAWATQAAIQSRNARRNRIAGAVAEPTKRPESDPDPVEDKTDAT